MIDGMAIELDGEVTPRVWRVREDNIDAYTITGTNTWISREPGSDRALVIDPGEESNSHLGKLLDVCETRLRCQVGAIAVTHGHPDHIGCAAALSEATGAPIFSRQAGNCPDGMFVPFDGCPEIAVVSTPGHTADSVSFLVKDDRSLVTGDFIFRDWSASIAHPEGSLCDYFASLDSVEELVLGGFVDTLLPAHGRVIEDPVSRLRAQRLHRRNRLEEIREAITSAKSFDAQALMPYVYADVKEDLRNLAEATLVAQLEYLKFVAFDLASRDT